jgi:hypothetical protein
LIIDNVTPLHSQEVDEKLLAEKTGSDDSDSSSSSSDDSDNSEDSKFGISAAQKTTSKRAIPKSASKTPKASAKRTPQKRIASPSAPKPSPKKGKSELSIAEAKTLLLSLSAQALYTPSNGSRERDVSSKLSKGRASLVAADTEQQGEATELEDILNRVEFLKNTFAIVNSSGSVKDLFTLDMAWHLQRCPKDDLEVTVACS